MMGAKLLLKLSLGALALGCLVTPATAQRSVSNKRAATIVAGSDTARELLLKSMQRTFSVNVVAIIVQRDPSGEASYQRVKVERATDGRTRHTVLQPLKMQGVESVDDGSRCRIYLPDQKLVIDQDSPLKYPCDLDKRMELATRNYSFRIQGEESIAGRKAICVVATPKNDDLEVRKYYLDRTTSYPLRMEAVSDSGASKTFFDTKEIRYPKSLDKDLFKIQTVGSVRVERYHRPRTVLNSNAGAALMGFTPVIPDSLPYGFKVLETQFNETPEWRALAMRITDGLVRATVYQWRVSSGAKVRTLEESTLMDKNGIRFMIVSDLSPKLRQRLLEAFVARAELPEAPPPAIFSHGLGPWLVTELSMGLEVFLRVDGVEDAAIR